MRYLNKQLRIAAVCVYGLLAISAQNDAHAQGSSNNSNAEIQIPAGTYTLDPSHASLVFSVNHLGFSFYTASFSDFDATLDIDPAQPTNAQLNATINVSSLVLPSPPEGFLTQMLGRQWFNTRRFAQMTFQSTAIEQTGNRTARITGNLTLLGVTKPVSFSATFNGGNAGVPGFDPRARIGFSAEGGLNRSDFGMTTSLPPEGSTLGVGDAVEFRIEAEFGGPAMSVTDPQPQ